MGDDLARQYKMDQAVEGARKQHEIRPEAAYGESNSDEDPIETMHHMDDPFAPVHKGPLVPLTIKVHKEQQIKPPTIMEHGIDLSQKQLKVIKIIFLVMGIALTVCLIMEIVYSIIIPSNKSRISDVEEEMSTTSSNLKANTTALTAQMASTKSSLETEMSNAKSELTSEFGTISTTKSTEVSEMEVEVESFLDRAEEEIAGELSTINTETSTQASRIAALGPSILQNADAISQIVGNIYMRYEVVPENSKGKVKISWIVNSEITVNSCNLSGTALPLETVGTNGDKTILDLLPSVYTYTVVCKNLADQDISTTIYVTVPTLIVTCTQLKAIGDTQIALSKYYGLAGNIDCASVTFAPIGSTSTPFKGTIEGYMFAISNLSVDTSSSSQGFIGSGNGATLRNIVFKNITIGATTGSYDAIAGVMAGGSAVRIENVHIRGGNIYGASNVGGLIGRSSAEYGSSRVVRCSVEATITSTGSNVGGLVGSSTVLYVEQSYTSGSIYQTGTYAGGLIGRANYQTNLTDSYSTIHFYSAGTSVAGIIAKYDNYYMSNSFYVGIIDPASRTSAGGVISEATAAEIGAGIFWDVEVSGVTHSLGIGFTTAKMKEMSTYVNYDFIDIWYMDTAQYPRLKWEKTILIP